MTILRNEFNQGYGGNQKVGYAFAIREGFDFVAMVHGDGQYAPEELPTLVAPLRDGRADAVFGSRMMTRLRCHQGRHAALQVRGQSDPQPRPEPVARHAPDRVPQRLPRLLGGGADQDSLSAQLEPVPLRHRDHHPAVERRAAHRGAADPDLLRRRDLPRQRAEVRRKTSCSRRCGTSPTGPASSTSAATSRSATTTTRTTT